MVKVPWFILTGVGYMSQQIDEIYAWMSEKPEQKVIFLGDDAYALFYYSLEDIEEWLKKLMIILEEPPV